MPSALRRLSLALIVLALAAPACEGAGRFRAPPADPPRGSAVPFESFAAGRMHLDSGVMVVRTDAEWRTLWWRWAAPHFHPDSPPPVDFRREMVAVVSYGGTSGCSDAARYVWRVERGRDSLYVVLAYPGYPDPPPTATCDLMVMAPDVVRFPRTDLPVRFVGYARGFSVPPPARWLERHTAAGTDTLEDGRRYTFRVLLARDSATGKAELEHLARTLPRERNVALFDALVEHPRVRADARLLTELAVLPGYSGTRAAELLLLLHGERLARDPATRPEVLRLLLQRLDGRTGHHEVGRLLARHPTVLGDRALLWDAYRFLTRKHITCAEGQKLWDRLHPEPPPGGRTPVCQPWDDSPRPPGLYDPRQGRLRAHS